MTPRSMRCWITAGYASPAYPQVLGNQRMQPGVALDVQFVDHCPDIADVGRWPRRRRVGDHDTEWHGGEGVGGVGNVVRLGCVVQNRTRVIDASGNRAGVRVEEQLGGIEAGAGGRVLRSVDAENRTVAGADAVDEDGPHSRRRPASCRGSSDCGLRRPELAQLGEHEVPKAQMRYRCRGCAHQ